MIFIAFLFSMSGLMAQNNTKLGVKKNQMHKIVFQMVSKDTADHNAMVRQLNNILKLSPGTKLEVVCHGPGLSFIHKDKSLVLNDLLCSKKTSKENNFWISAELCRVVF